MNHFTIILPAAGASSRFGGGQNKLLEPLAGEPVLLRTLQAFAGRADVSRLILATSLDPQLWSSLPDPLRAKIHRCPGGGSRAHSVLAALREASPEVPFVAVHDAARPLVSQGLIDRVFAAAVQYGAAAPALPVHLTIKRATGPLPAPVERTIPRHTLWAMQTPQVMRRSDLLEAYDRCPLPLEQVTDDVQLIELQGGQVWLVPGEEQNLKITTSQDMRLAESLLSDS